MQQVAEKNVEHYLFASLQTSAVRWAEHTEILGQALGWYRHLVGLGHYHLPFSLVLDLGLLLHRGHETPFASEKEYKDWTDKERGIRLRYENEFLGRLLQESLLLEALELLRLQEQEEAPRLRLMELLWQSLAPHYPRHMLIHPAHLRFYNIPPESLPSPLESLHALQDMLPTENFFLQQLSHFLENIGHQIQWSRLLHPEDLFELEHWKVLDSEAQRIGCRQILEVHRRLGEIEPRRIDLSHEHAETETAFVDETYYPTGGLTELTNRGSFENLVLSELTYMESERPDEIDLFDVRFVEGELLFYKRDAGQLRRKRRTVHMILDLGEYFQHKSAGYEYQFAILIQGLVLRVIHDLLLVFALDAMAFHIHYITNPSNQKLVKHEMELMRLLLKDEEQHGWIQFHLTDTIELDRLPDPKRKTYAIVLTGDSSSTDMYTWEQNLSQQPRLWGTLVTLCQTLETSNTPTLSIPVQGMPFSQVIALKESMIEQVVRP